MIDLIFKLYESYMEDMQRESYGWDAGKYLLIRTELTQSPAFRGMGTKAYEMFFALCRNEGTAYYHWGFQYPFEKAEAEGFTEREYAEGISELIGRGIVKFGECRYDGNTFRNGLPYVMYNWSNAWKKWQPGKEFDQPKFVNNLLHGRNSKEYQQWKKAVLERDRVCQKCGKAENLNVHHRKSWSKHPNLRFNVDNGIVLCEEHHIEIDKDFRKFKVPQ